MKLRKVPRALTTMRDKGQITIPTEIRKAARLEEGDSVEASLTPDGILLRPRRPIDSTQAWFWEPKWQARERGAGKDIAMGNVRTFKTEKAFMKDLD
jgi:AbrB family looped-hinge helix DNA binding protein